MEKETETQDMKLWISTQIHGKTMETVADFSFFSSKITANGDCSHEIKRCLILERKVMTDSNSVLKSRHYFANKNNYFVNKSNVSFDSFESKLWFFQ